MRIVVSILVCLAVSLSSGCAIYEKETTNRGGYLDYVLDQHWLKADSKSMRALRAFAVQVSLARIASVAAKNEADRQLLAIRIGALTKRFGPVYNCAFDNNPLTGAERDPCFYYDSAMVDYSTGLFDLAVIALPIDDAKKLISTVTGSAVNPINLLELLESLLAIGKDALQYGRVVGALYRDTMELEVQVWLGTPVIDDRPLTHRVTEEHVAGLREIYARRNDDMLSWIAAIGELRSQGLEPLPQKKFFVELGGLMKYICDLITKDPDASARCKAGLPTTMPPPATALSVPALPRVGAAVTTTKVTTLPSGGGSSNSRPSGQSTTAPAGQSTTTPAGESTTTPAGQSTTRPSGQSTVRPSGPDVVELARDTASRELDIFVRPGGQGTPADPDRQAKLDALLRQISPNAPDLLEVIRFKQHQDLRNRLVAALRASPPVDLPGGSPSGPGTTGPAPDGQTVRLARDPAARELDAFVRPGGPGTPAVAERQARLEGLLRQINPNAPPLLDVIRFEPHLDLRNRILAAYRASSLSGASAPAGPVRLARDQAARELDAYVRPAGPGTPPNQQRQAKLQELLRQINSSAPDLLDVIRFEPHQDLRDKLLAALKANP